MNSVVTELTIDARGADAGSAAYVRYMQVAQAAVDRLIDREMALKTASDANAVSMISTSTSTQRAASAFDRLKASIDPAFAAAKGLEREILTLDRAVTRLGVSEQEAARLMDMIVLKHNAAAQAAKRQTDEYLRLAAAGREALQADRAQGSINRTLGVSDPAGFVGTARTSAGTFSAELDRLDEIGRQKAQQIGQNFGRDLDASLVAGTGKSARDAATVFSAQLDQLDEIAKLRALEAGSAFTSDLNARLGIGVNAGSARDSAGVFTQQAREAEAYGRQVAFVRAQIDPLGVAIEQLNSELAVYATMMQRGDLTTQQFATAQRMAQARVDELRYHVESGRRNEAMGGNMMSSINAAQQLQDIGMMALSGQSVGMLSIQQGPQLATAIQQGGGLAVLGAGLTSLFSLTTLLTIGFTAATAATIQWFMKGREGAKSLEETLKGHSETLGRLKQQYGELGEASKSLGPVGGRAYTDAQARQEVATLQAAIRSQSGDMSKALLGGGFLRSGLFGSDTSGLDELLKTRNSPFQSVVDDLFKSIRAGNGGLEKFDENLNRVFDTLRSNSSNPAALNEELQRLSDAATSAFGVSGKFAPFQSEIDRLLLGLKEGNGDISTFATNVRRIGELNGIQKVADDAILSAKEVVGLAEKLREVQDILQRIDREDTRPGLRDLRTLPAYVNRRDAETRQLDEQAAADRQLARARTNAERMAGIDAQVRSRARQDGDAGGGLQARVDRALAEERNRQEVEARDAALQRNLGLQSSLDQRRLELDLIGKTAGETERLRFEFERMQELREESARTGSPIDPKEVANIEAAAAAMGKYAEALGRAKLVDDLQFERSQIGRSDLEQSVASQLRGAGLAVDLSGQDAAMIRSNELLKRQVELFKDIRKSGMDAYSDIFDLAFDGFDNWEHRLSDIGKDMAKNLFDLSIKNPFINERYPEANLPTLSQTGGIGGFFSAMLGLTPNPAAGAQNVGAMTVNAGSVVVTGSIGASGGGGLLNRIFSPANGNGGSGLKASDMPPMSLSGIGSPTGGGSYGSDMASNIRVLASNIGAKPRDLAALMSFESGLNPKIWGGTGGNHYGLIQAGANERSTYGINPGGSLADQFSGIERYFKDRGFKPGMSGLDLYSTVNAGSPGRYNASDTANGGTWGTVADKWNHQMDAHFAKADALLNSSTQNASGALEKLAGSSANTAQSLAGGLGKLGNALNQFPSAPGGGGGIGLFGALGSLFGGGLNSAFSGTSAFSWLSANPGGFVGLYHDGRYPGNPGGSRFADLSWFAGAPRYHNGRVPDLAPDEEPAILRKNEPVFRSMDHARQVVGGGTTVVNQIDVINNAGVRVREESSDDGQGGRRTQLIIEEHVGSAVNRKGSAANKALASMGLTRPMKVR